jgi:nucleotide-binding universal stress UspA family protein
MIERRTTMFNKILLATDGSPSATEAGRYVSQLAKLTGAQVIVLHAYPRVPAFLGEPNLSQMIHQNLEEADRIVAPVVEGLAAAGVDVSAEMLEGPPAEAILAVAESSACDLIVMGTRGYGHLAGMLLGSVSHKVLANATMPVLVVRPE